MSSVKRKAVTEERPNKKSRNSDAAETKRPEKKSETPPNPTKSKKSGGEDGERKAPVKSILQREEKAFPRGGGSVLTPIEQKQIRVQAEQDVFFEQQTGQKAPAREDEDGALFDEETEAAPAAKKHKSKKNARDAPAKVPGSGIRIQGLSYKNLVVGSQVLGYVTAITGKDVALALANNLTGYVPITAISQLLNERIEKLLAEDEMKDDGEDEDIDLKSLFHVGQWLRATVMSTGSDAGEGKSKRHIELSVEPQSVNGGLEADNVVVDSMLQASVRSVEDHGLVMDLGLSSADVKGFVSKKELGIGYELEKMQEGQVLMCLVTGKGSNGKVLKLSPDALRFSALVVNKAPVVSEAPTVEAFLPGTAVQILVTETSAGGVAGKVMGMVETTADLVHSGAGAKDVDMSKKFKVGSKVKGRIVWTLPNDDGSRRVGVSMLDTMLALPPPVSKLPENASPKQKLHSAEVSPRMAPSSIVADATVTQVLPERGIFLSLPSASGTTLSAFAHISQISDKRIDVLTSASGPYKLGSTHKARVISHNPVDNLYHVALKESVLAQTFLRIEDLNVGEVVSGTVDRLILGGKTGITGVLVKLSEGVTGLVPDMHLSDVQLQHPERKFREGFPVKGRVLSVDLEKRHVRLTLKKSLINDESGVPLWKKYSELTPGMEGKGTIVNLLANGGVVQFFDNVRAWLPVAEMGEGFIQDPKQQFRLGQTVNVRIVSVTPETQEMKVSCKQDDTFDDAQQSTWDALSGGDLVSGSVTVNGGESVELDLENGLRGILKLGHLADGEASKAESALKRIRVGQKLTDLLVLNKLQRSRQVLLSNKPSLLKAARDQLLLRSFDDVKEETLVHGFARNITPEGIYVEYADGLVGLVPKSLVDSDLVGKPAFGLVENQTVKATVLSVDAVRERFTLTMREQSGEPAQKPTAATPGSHSVTMGQVVKVKIASVRSTQINVRHQDGAQGRVDFSEIFDSWEDILNKKAPLQKFKPNEEIEVKVLGVHDAKNHRFLPISHRQSKAPVYELSAKRTRVQGGNEDFLSLDSVKAGSSQVVFVNNHGDNCIWASLSPNVRGRIALMDLSDDVGMLQKLEKNFPVGSALRVQVKSVDLATGRLDFITASGQESTPVTLAELSPGMVLPGRVTKITERGVNVQLSDNLAGPVPLTELSDDFDQANPSQYNRNDIVRVCVLGVDASNKKVFLSLRPSKVLSSSLPVKDAQINTVSQLEAGQLVRGFVKHVGDRGVIVSLSARVDAFVRISDLSDSYVKDWKTIVEVDQLVTGRILNVDTAARNVQISLKASHVDKDYKSPLTIAELKAGMIITGKVRKVEDFGAFIDIDNTMPKLSGLCHRSEVASKRVEDVRKLYGEGDVVKAKILNVDVDKRKISLGLKASYFAEAIGEEDEEEEDDEMEGVELDGESDDAVEVDTEGGVELEDVQDMDSDDEEAAEAVVLDEDDDLVGPTEGLKTAGFDWTGDAFDNNKTATLPDSEPDTAAPKKKKRKAEIKVDMTGDLDKYGPRNASDFERQLLGQPNNSGLWIQYMAFQLQLSETQAARDLAERALRTIHIRESEEKGNIWIAWLNLEVEYGDDERVDDVFKQACQVQDPLVMHEKLASILINSGKYGKAEDVFEKMVGNKSFRANGDMWLNYASFLMEKMKNATRARSMLSRALQSVPANEHRLLTAKFAGLEFRSSEGDPERARTIFEGLVTEWPKWSGGWDMWVDLEQSRVAHAEGVEAKNEAREKVQALFERMTRQKMKPRRAKFVFKRWLVYEENHGDAKGRERVEGLARSFVEGLRKGDVEE
ncbi:rRNA biogenesis protein rrp5 [Recurvomyces mirabilis]|uniref:rRNA biogenesis protein RRP5 n=1 Tax=Recurvomyces mirabilis TaxID=574656 RepID=A0AAE1C6I3_9PEZI|nr:rRNA biogenesis protein rrp5 [Recurvomyces mirabilis]KAK5162152.1 rRNA biogenesis protein rrp5 [Recurvomyces mirabilis]